MFFHLPDTLTGFYSGPFPSLYTEEIHSTSFLSGKQALYQATQGDRTNAAWLWARVALSGLPGPVESGLCPPLLTESIPESPQLSLLPFLSPCAGTIHPFRVSLHCHTADCYLLGQVQAPPSQAASAVLAVPSVLLTGQDPNHFILHSPSTQHTLHQSHYMAAVMPTNVIGKNMYICVCGPSHTDIVPLMKLLLRFHHDSPAH